MPHFNLDEIEVKTNIRGVSTKTIVDHEHATIKNLLLNPGDSIPPHQVPVNVTFFILDGQGSITLGNDTHPVKKGDIVLCSPNVSMSVQADDNHSLSFLNIKTPGLNPSK